MGFVLSLNLINVDGLIIRQNVTRALNNGGSREAFDFQYLQTLSTDATPALIRAQQNSQLPEAERNELAAILACQIAEMAEVHSQQRWQSFHYADSRAWRLLTEHRDDFRAVRVYEGQYGWWWVMVNGDRRACQYNYD